MKKIRVGFVGAGRMGQCAHLKNYVTLPDCEVVAIAELRTNLAHKVAMRYGISRVYSNHKEMLEKENLDAIVASQPFTIHGQLIPELLSAHIPVFIEKPLASSVETGQKIVEAISKSGTWVMVGYHKRSDPATMFAKSEIEKLKASGEIGRVSYIRILMPPGDWIASGFSDLIQTEEEYPHLKSDPQPSEMDKATFDNYIKFVNYYIHQVNLMRYLLGESYRVSYADPSGILLIGQSVSGVTCCIEMAPYQTTIDWQESVMVAFQRGWVKVELPAPLTCNRPGSVEIFKDPGKGIQPTKLIPQLPWIHAMRQQAINFVRAVRGEIPPTCTAEEALEDLIIAKQYLDLLTKNKKGE